VKVRVDPAVLFDTGVTELSEKTALTPLGNPVTLSATAESKPFKLATVTALVPQLPCSTLMDAGESDKENAAGGG
jgi:hypothetical protein